MNAPAYQVLFICTGNSARSILAEALMNQLGGERFHAVSAGSHPRGELHPLALRTLAHLGVPTAGLRSKSWNEFAGPGAATLDFAITVCDNAAGEVCPVWPGQPMTAHWGLPDPGHVEGGEEQQFRAFLDTAVALKRRIELLLALPVSSLDRMSLQSAVRDIGHQ
jgi:arsenate reductase